MSTIFPTQYSTLSSKHLGKYIGEKYGFTEVLCTFLLRGVSDTYVIEHSEGKAILKIYRDSHRSLDEIQGEVELLAILKSEGGKVAEALIDLEGNTIQSFQAAEGIRNGVVFRYALGKNVYDFTDEQLEVLGREMAFNHLITSQVELSYPRQEYTIETTIDRPLEVLKPFLKDFQEEYEYLLETAGRVKEKMESYDLQSFSYGYCHYDYLPKNFHFDEHNTITVFDYDFAGKGLLMNDIMTFMMHYFFHTTLNRISYEEGDQHFTLFIESYRKVKAVSDQELELMPYLGFGFWLFYLGFQCENFDDWSNTFFSSRYLQDRISVIKKYMGRYCSL